MLIKYQMHVRFSSDEFTPEGGILPSALLLRFQTAAGIHADENGVGFEALINKDLIWVITRARYRVLAPLKPDTDYILTTYPLKAASLIYQRDFYISLPGGTPVAVATSQWCIINYTTRAVERAAIEFEGEYYDKDAIPEGIKRLRPKNSEAVGSHTVLPSDLDRNDHTNNCRYADMALPYLNSVITDFTINFAKETRLGDEITLMRSPDGTVSGALSDGTLVFAASSE